MTEWRNPAAGNATGWGPRLPHPITVVFTTDPEAPWIAFPVPHGTLPAERREEGFWKSWIQSLGPDGPTIGIGTCPQDAVASLLYAASGPNGPNLLMPAMSERALADAFQRVLLGNYISSELVADPEDDEKLRADFKGEEILDGQLVILTGDDRISVMQALDVDKENDKISWNILLTIPRVQEEEAPGPKLVKDPPAKKAAAKKRAPAKRKTAAKKK